MRNFVNNITNSMSIQFNTLTQVLAERLDNLLVSSTRGFGYPHAPQAWISNVIRFRARSYTIKEGLVRT